MTDTREKFIAKLQVEVILLSLALVAGAAAWTWQIGMAANALDHRAGHAAEDIMGLRRDIERMEAKKA